MAKNVICDQSKDSETHKQALSFREKKRVRFTSKHNAWHMAPGVSLAEHNEKIK